ncbi:hypothetical protein G9A89_009408 [Geosiphon pyriformis]|nr:hypothetical protein G9A89_009408 [Geosiphon pyriformis]
MSTCCNKNEEWMTATEYYCCPCILEHNGWLPKIGKWDRYQHDEDEIWRMTYAMLEGATTEKLKEIKNNPLSLPESKYVQTFDAFGNIKDDPEEFYKHYQRLALMRKEQEQCLEEINTQLCDYCLIPCNFQYCDKCNFIYNLPPRMIYTILEEKKPISSCTSESKSLINRDSDSNDNDENTGSSSVQNSNNNKNNSNSDSNSELNYEQYIALPDFSKEQELKWYSDNRESIMPECVHDTDAEFDLRYPGKDAIKLAPDVQVCIDLKIALEIPATTMVLLASRSSLAKKEINIKGGIVDAGYTGNISTMLQNDLEKAYTIEPNKKIA